MDTKHIARRHHYLPQAYLAAFTDTGLEDGQFNVLDVQSGYSFRTSPINVAAERDFNRIDIEGHSPDEIEQALAPLEAQAVAAIRKVIETEKFPNDDDWNWILNLLGLIAIRNPRLRKSFNYSLEQTVHRIGDLLVSDKKIWDHHVKKVRKSGEKIDDNVSFEDVKRFVEGRRYQIEVSTESNLRIEFRVFDRILPILGQRMWSVLVAPRDGPEFICSDHPVTLVWKGGRSGPVGYALKETEIFFPLGRCVGFYGVFETPLKPVVKCKHGHVATMNRRIMWNSERHVYSALDYFFIWHGGQIRKVQCTSDISVQPTPDRGGY
jgi:hypothetical protein